MARGNHCARSPDGPSWPEATTILAGHPMRANGNRRGARATGVLCLSALWVAALVGAAAGEMRAFSVILALALAVAFAARLLLAPMMGWNGRAVAGGIHGARP